jgi:hypothetical protein
VQYAVVTSTVARPASVGDLALALAQVPGVRVALRSSSYTPSDQPAVFLRQLQHTHIVCSSAAGEQRQAARTARALQCPAPGAPIHSAPARPLHPNPPTGPCTHAGEEVAVEPDFGALFSLRGSSPAAFQQLLSLLPERDLRGRLRRGTAGDGAEGALTAFPRTIAQAGPAPVSRKP